MSPKLILLIITSYIYCQISIRTINKDFFDAYGNKYYRNYNKLSLNIYKTLSIILFGTVLKNKISLWFVFMQIINIFGVLFTILCLFWRCSFPTIIQTRIGYGIGMFDLLCIFGSIVDDFINNK